MCSYNSAQNRISFYLCQKFKQMEILHSEYFALFVIITIGFLLGRIKIKDISLDISAIIFVALFFGHFGVQISESLQQIGLLFFIYTVGLGRAQRNPPVEFVVNATSRAGPRHFNHICLSLKAPLSAKMNVFRVSPRTTNKCVDSTTMY